MKDYFAVLGYAVVNPQFRQDLLAQGHGAVASNNLSVTLNALDIAHLNDFMTADPPEKAQVQQAFDDALVAINAACQNPPCPYASSFDDDDGNRQVGRPKSEQRRAKSKSAKAKSRKK